MDESRFGHLSDPAAPTRIDLCTLGAASQSVLAPTLHLVAAAVASAAGRCLTDCAGTKCPLWHQLPDQRPMAPLDRQMGTNWARLQLLCIIEHSWATADSSAEVWPVV